VAKILILYYLEGELEANNKVLRDQTPLSDISATEPLKSF
jgi:hypothetical protein